MFEVASCAGYIETHGFPHTNAIGAVRLTRGIPFLRRASLLGIAVVASPAEAQAVGEAEVSRSAAGTNLGGRVARLQFAIFFSVEVVAFGHVCGSGRSRQD